MPTLVFQGFQQDTAGWLSHKWCPVAREMSSKDPFDCCSGDRPVSLSSTGITAVWMFLAWNDQALGSVSSKEL